MHTAFTNIQFHWVQVDATVATSHSSLDIPRSAVSGIIVKCLGTPRSGRAHKVTEQDHRLLNDIDEKRSKINICIKNVHHVGVFPWPNSSVNYQNTDLTIQGTNGYYCSSTSQMLKNIRLMGQNRPSKDSDLAHWTGLENVEGTFKWIFQRFCIFSY